MPKGLFIGLGGAGMTTVARLKALLFQRVYKSSKADMDAECSFIFYDTDEVAMKYICEDAELQKMMGQNPVIDAGREYINAGQVSPYSMYMYSKEHQKDDEMAQRMLEWAIDPDVDGHYKLPLRNLIEGVGADRMAGRCGYVFKRRELETKIRSGIEKLEVFGEFYRIQEDHPAIWVFSSSNGGTSSSALLDVLYREHTVSGRLYRGRSC